MTDNYLFSFTSVHMFEKIVPIYQKRETSKQNRINPIIIYSVLLFSMNFKKRFGRARNLGYTSFIQLKMQ